MTAPARKRVELSSLLRRPLTLGVKAVVTDVDQRILLVRHGYLPGWHFPGGGVDAGETCVEALARELEEEAMIAIDAPPLLHGIFHNIHASRRDHVAVYLVPAFRILGERKPNWEIREARFFPRAALPEGTTAATRARLAEIFEKAPIAVHW